MRWYWGLGMMLYGAAALAWEMDDAVLVSASQSFGAGASQPMLRIEAMHYDEDMNLMLPIAGFGVDPRLHVEPTVLGLAIGAELAAMQRDEIDAPATKGLLSRRYDDIALPYVDFSGSCDTAPTLTTLQLQSDELVAEAESRSPRSASRRAQPQQRQ